MGSVSGYAVPSPRSAQASRTGLLRPFDDRQIGQIEAIILLDDRRPSVPDPAIIDGARRVRIANGSGTATSDVNALLKQFKEMQKMMKGFGEGRHGRGHGRARAACSDGVGPLCPRGAGRDGRDGGTAS